MLQVENNLQSGPHNLDKLSQVPAEDGFNEVLRLRGGVNGPSGDSAGEPGGDGAGGPGGDGASGPGGDIAGGPGGDGAGGLGGDSAGGPGGDSMLAAARGTTSALNLSQVQTSIIVF